MKNMKRIVLFALAALMLLSSVGCGAPAPAATEAPKAEAPAATEAPAEGGCGGSVVATVAVVAVVSKKNLVEVID